MAKFLFIFFLSSGLFSSHLLGKNAADFHILTAICSFLSEAHQVLLTHRKHIEIDCVFLCVHACVCFFQHAFFFFCSVFFLQDFFPSLFFNRILLLSHAFLSVAIMTNYSVARGRIHYPFPFTSRTHIIWKLQGGGGWQWFIAIVGSWILITRTGWGRPKHCMAFTRSWLIPPGNQL